MDDEKDDEVMMGAESNSEEEEEESGDEDMEEVLDILASSPSPPPEKKGMAMRSGRTKRRRSTETTGLTPPEKQKDAKRARTTNRKATNRKAEVQNGEATESSAAASVTSTTTKPPMVPVSQRSARTSVDVAASARTVDGKAKRISSSSRSSMLSTDATAVATAQDPESSMETGGVLADGEANRQLFAAQSPIVTKPPKADSVAEPIREEHEEPRPTSPEQNVAEEKHEDDIIGQSDSDTKTIVSDWRSKPIIWRIAFMLIFAFPMALFLWPVCVKVSNIMIPLKELTLPPPTQVTEVIIESGDHETDTLLEPPTKLAESIQSLPKLKLQVERGRQLLEQFFASLAHQFGEISFVLEEKQAVLERMSLLSQAEMLLLESLNQGLESETWQNARTLANSIGHTIIDTPSIPLWQVNAPQSCHNTVNTPVTITEDGNFVVTPTDVNQQLGELSRMTQMSVASLLMSTEVEGAVRKWIKAALESTVSENPAVRDIIAHATEMPDGPVGHSNDAPWLSRDEIKEIIAERLNIELADRTGSYDHASIYNGARIIRSGKRATSQSLVDTLPLGNRLLQLSQLQFYGFGPEAAITPTYPVGALGQCWSFQEMSIDALQKLPRSQSSRDEQKNGNLGTLTISLPTAVAVRSVIIEHPPPGATDQANSAIRGFRVIGYEDAEAVTKSWPLGSFEYDIRKSSSVVRSVPKIFFLTFGFSVESSISLQEFEVETKMFGGDVPPLRSITLAIDSNWGNAYSCLYRFRVHGEEMDVNL